MVRSKLRNKYNKERSTQSCIVYKQQRNIFTNLLRTIKSNFDNNLNPANISDNNRFWKNVKPTRKHPILISMTLCLTVSKMFSKTQLRNSILIWILISYQNPTI